MFARPALPVLGFVVIGFVALMSSGCASASSGEAARPTVPSSTKTPEQASPLLPPAAPTVTPEPEATPTATPEPTVIPEPLVTRTGAGVLVDTNFELLAGHRIGLIAHRASVVDRRHLAELINEHPAVELAALFAPEHGLYGTDEAGALVVDGFDPTTNTPVFSLYGTSRSPSPEALADIDVLVYDLQDVGARFFTYTSTLGLAMQAAAQADIPIVVLDRPNPLGAATLQGPTLAADLTSFIGMYPVPSAYGLTSGELATLIQQQRLLPGLDQLSLQVVAMQNWDRDMRWHHTGLPWISPSPNLRTSDAALMYPGTVLFEATSISEGRGTDEPFQLIGAPWVDRADLAAQMNALDLAGVHFEAASFTPHGVGEELHGVHIVVTDPSSIAGLEIALHLLDAMLRQGETVGIAPTTVIDRPDVFDRLAGSATVRAALIAGTDISQLIASFETDHVAFRELAAEVLLYE